MLRIPVADVEDRLSDIPDKPMIGYYEWTGEKGNKQGHFIHAAEDSLAAAGLTWTTDISGERRRER